MLTIIELMLICHHFYNQEVYYPMTGHVGESYATLVEKGMIIQNRTTYKITDKAQAYLRSLPRYED